MTAAYRCAARCLTVALLLAVGCAESTPPAAAPASPQPRRAESLVLVDAYWSADRETYYVVVGNVHPRTNYCTGHLLLDGRRTGESGAAQGDGSSTATVPFLFVEYPFDDVYVDCR